jgi:CBS domain-containing protein
MRAKDVMSTEVISIMADATVFEAAERMVNAGISAMPVVGSNGDVVGILSEADLIRRAEIGTAPQKSWLARLLADDYTTASSFVHSHARHVRDVMTKKVITVELDADLSDVANLMEKHAVKRVPVVRNGILVGIVSRANLLQALLSCEPADDLSRHPADEQLRREVLEAVRKRPWSSAGLINVVVSGGVVHLWGYVANDAVFQAYRVAAENVPGVKSVKNHMRTTPASVHMGV